MTTEGPGQTTAGRLAGRNLQRWRKARGWSRQDVADRMGALGVPATDAILANFESGRGRVMSVEDALAVAAVLNIGLADLLFSQPPFPFVNAFARVTPLPGLEMSGEQAFDWLTGRQPLPGADPQDFRRYAPEHARPTDADQHPAMRALRDLEGAVRSAILGERAPGPRPTPKNLIRRLQSAGRAVQRYAEALAAEVEQQLAEVEED